MGADPLAVARLRPTGVRPVGLATTTTRPSAAALASAISHVASRPGPTATVTAIEPS